ncbi:callose synthase 12-like [Magnolia sinica]|uniref:callose synthase 12-like n=1 Tax=Magnolia sinica TaxID=86752 RepID=UPI00265A7327|nr:callose synthase 12-like [Magnolia sinica]XP_058100553.1 callose synthase 12-like [Magnolia sinica]XP_058100554.1 callose synthase 12-like [Magnolia sinica]XP_058100555.1 callose synthase 12-like [Magnolia sinica]
MSLRQRQPQAVHGRGQGPGSGYGPHRGPTVLDEEPFNIIPIHNALFDHPSLRYPEVRAAAAVLRMVGDLRRPPFVPWHDGMDILDWLGAFFGFQRDNVRNQREHLVLLLANAQMRAPLAPEHAGSLDPAVVRSVRRKLLSNYYSWCGYLGRKSNISISERRNADPRRELLFTSLYLLVWGEAANLRFVPECICYIYHHMASELHRVLEGFIDDNTGRPILPSVSGENAFLLRVITPIYQTIKAEVDASRNGTAPHSAWRNYDDINEYFWSRRCFNRLKWPLDLSSNFFVTGTSSGGHKKVGKTGFVEQRSFWNVFRNFDRLWVMHILFLQAAIIVAWQGTKYPWGALQNRDVQVRVLSIFITWGGLRFVQSVLDAGTQYSLVSRETPWIGVRMVLKSVASMAWTVAFGVLYGRIWSQRYRDRRWSYQANLRVWNFLEAMLVFLLPELLAIILFILPWIRNFLEKANWKILYVVMWWFQGRTFVGRGLREGIIDNLKYSLFWVMVLASKFSFSYFLQIKPMIGPTKAILNIRRINPKWHEFFGNTNRFAVVLIWLPVVLIFLMDMQIWYSIFSSIVGALIGLLSHLGEIRNINQLRLRFEFFASAMQFNLIPEEHPFEKGGTLMSKFSDAVNRLKLRYGLGRPYKKIESYQEANRFALVWNEIILSFREEDIISDHELELMELPPNSWNIRVIRWPCILLCNQLLLALNQAKELDVSDKVLWQKICKNEYQRCAVVEAYDSVKYLLPAIIMDGTEDHSIVLNLFVKIDKMLQFGEFTQTYRTAVLPAIHAKLISLVDILISPNKELSKVVNTLQTLYDIWFRDLPKVKRPIEELRQEGLVPRQAMDGLLFENAVMLPSTENTAFYWQVRRLQTILMSRDSMNNIPVNLEARRRIAFFSNSLFMNMPRAPPVEKMLAFSVLTPYYSEDVLYSREQLRTDNEDGVSILFYLQKVFDDEWHNFLERMRRNGMNDDEDIWTDRLRDLRLWASYRGQTLARTVRGMMYYDKALKMLAFLDTASEMDISEGTRKLAVIGSTMRSRSKSKVDGLGTARSLTSKGVNNMVSSGVDMLFKGHEYGAALMKYTYVVACQIYGSQKAKKDPRAEEILYLMRENEALRVAYVDEVHTGRDEVEYYSVLVKFDQRLQKEVEIYRIRLPGPLKLGEGKPENQNHAIIFTRGDAVQTIDMNQDHYFEESLKIRNLLEEFPRYYGIRRPTILGVRENIFTGSVSSLAWFMSAQETSFVTLGQRVLANPLKVRMHYGHPDVFDRLWFMSRGGLSKASRVINISEDIFAGFNCTLRGGNVTHHEYIQVGKGRDVGLNQISMFEAKVASGNGEQMLSRDVYRLGHRLDFFRMLSFYYTTVGFFFNTMAVVVTVYVFVWGRLYMALSGIEDAIRETANSTSNKALGAVLNQQFVIQMGLFTALPMIVENTLEHGFLPAVWDFLTMQFQLSSCFYTFSMGTRTHFFGRTILHGGAKYRATGRGFVVQHKCFAENYRLYARSHFVKAIELGVILTVYASYSPVAKSTFVYIIMTISSWVMVASWIMAPFVFNPSGFDWLKTVYDFDDFMNWIWYRGGVFTKAEQSWETWWYEEQDHLRTTGLWGKLLEIILDLRYFFFQYGIVYQLGIANKSTSIAVYLLSWIYVVVAVAIYLVIMHAHDKYAAKEHIYYRAVELFIICLTTLVVIILLRFTQFKFIDLLTSLMAFIPTGWGIICIAQVLRSFLQPTVVWETVVSLARLYDILFGVFVMAPVALLSWMPGFQAMQTRILFNQAFSRGLQISRILTGKRSNG